MKPSELDYGVFGAEETPEEKARRTIPAVSQAWEAYKETCMEEREKYEVILKLYTRTQYGKS